MLATLAFRDTIQPRTSPPKLQNFAFFLAKFDNFANLDGVVRRVLADVGALEHAAGRRRALEPAPEVHVAQGLRVAAVPA